MNMKWNLFALCRIGNTLKLAVVIVGVSGMSACRDIVSGVQLPNHISDPSVVKNESGAIAVYAGIRQAFASIYAGGGRLGEFETEGQFNFVKVTGLLTDELSRVPTTSDRFPSLPEDFVDARVALVEYLSRNGDNIGVFYENLNAVRVRSQEARGLMRKYASGLPTSFVGHLFLIEAYATAMLGELYCSGIPLPTVDFERDYTITRGFTTTEVFRQSVSLFDSAITNLPDSLELQNFARLGLARALLSIGELERAKAVVESVPTSFIYSLSFTAGILKKYVITPQTYEGYGNSEGLNGLPFAGGADPRITLPELTDQLTPLPLATGIEARLIEVEAKLVAGDASWLTQLNRLRTHCATIEACDSPAAAGDAGIAGLPPLMDPGNSASMSDTASLHKRLALIFTERAYWLFLQGRRQGDLRRAVRNYKWRIVDTYPVGAYRATEYGPYINLPLPMGELTPFNPNYTGCFDRNA